jgi:hypothetical protein
MYPWRFFVSRQRRFQRTPSSLDRCSTGTNYCSNAHCTASGTIDLLHPGRGALGDVYRFLVLGTEKVQPTGKECYG